MGRTANIPANIPATEPRLRSRAVRWLLRVLLGVSAAMMIVVVLSEPRISAQVRAGVGDFVEGLGLSVPAIITGADPPPGVQVPGARALVNVMPTNRVPVRRATGN